LVFAKDNVAHSMWVRASSTSCFTCLCTNGFHSRCNLVTCSTTKVTTTSAASLMMRSGHVTFWRHTSRDQEKWRFARLRRG